MGMYDELICEVALPDLGIREGKVFQTKSLFCVMAKLKISKDGRLIEQRVRFEWDKRSQAQPSERAIPVCRRIPLGERDLMFHGDVAFYVSQPEEFQGDMIARFTEGQLQWIRTADSVQQVIRDVIYERQG